MGWFSWFKPKPQARPPVVALPIVQRLTMHAVVKDTQGNAVERIEGEMGPPTDPNAWGTVHATPLVYYMLEFVAPPQVRYGDPVSLLFKAKGCEPLAMQAPFAANMNVNLAPLAPPVRHGVVSLVGHCWRDDDGLFHPLGTTLMHAVGSWHRGEQDRMRQNFAYAKKTGKRDALRILGMVNWAGEEIDPRWPDYQATLGAVLDSIYQEGMRTHLVVTGGGADPVGAARIMLPVLQARREKLLLIEAANEQNASTDDAIAIIDILSAVGVPCALGLGNAGLENINKATAHSKANVGILHEERSDDPTRNIRQCWDFRLLEGAPCAAEGQGPASSVVEETLAFNLAAARAARIICGAGYVVTHTGHGVFGRTYPYNATTPPGEPHSDTRFANLWEFPNADADFGATANAHKRLPQGIENWAKFNSNHPVDVPAGNVNKIYGAIFGGPFAEIVNAGHVDTVMLRAQQPCQLQVSNPATDQVLFEGHLGAGQQVPVSGITAYVLVGTIG